MKSLVDRKASFYNMTTSIAVDKPCLRRDTAYMADCRADPPCHG